MRRWGTEPVSSLSILKGGREIHSSHNYKQLLVFPECMHSSSSNGVPRYPVRQTWLWSILEPFQHLECYGKLCVNIQREEDTFVPIILGSSYLIALYFLLILQMSSAQRHRYRVFAWVYESELFSWNNDSHWMEIKLKDYKLNIRNRCLCADHFSYIFPLSPF